MTQKLMELSPESFTEVRRSILNFCELNYLESKVSADLSISYEFVLKDYIINIIDNSLEILFKEEHCYLLIRRKRC